MKDIHYRLAKNLADLLDNRFKIFGIRFGLDPILSLIPGFGDIIGSAVGFYLIYVAKILNLPKPKVNKMLLNLVLDFAIGLVPIAGVTGDVFFRSNQMNWKIIKEHMEKSDIKEHVEEGEIVG